MLWLVAAALAAVVAVAILAPFLRRAPTGSAGLAPAAYDLRLYTSQLAEVDRDLGRGLILPAEADRLRLEIGRRVLEADRALGAGIPARPGPTDTRRAPLVMAVLVTGLAVAAFALYQRIGAPGMPDEPIATRFAVAEQTYRSRPTQAEAEARAAASAAPVPPADPEYLALIQQLRATVAQHPGDPRGLDLLARGEARLGRPAAAAEAMRRLLALKGDTATAADHARLAGLMAEAAGGLVTPEGEAEAAAALRLDPAEPQARYIQGLLMIQNRRPDRAFPIWRALLEEGPADAPWAAPIARAMPDLAWLAGVPEYQPPATAPATATASGGAALPGPDAEAVAAAEGLSDEARRQMVQGMVSGLEQRLATQGGSAEEWARLIGALHVLGDDAHAAEILAEARSRFAAVPAARAVIDAAATRAALP